MKRLLISAVALVAQLESRVHARELEHLAAPPTGYARLALRSEPMSSPLQLLGTVRPPALIFNGKPLVLLPVAAEESPYPGSSGLWIDGRAVEVEGTAGRFFVDLREQVPTTGRLEFLIKPTASQAFVASLPWDRTFLDQSLAQEDVRAVSPDPGAKFDFELVGRLPAGSRLEISEGEVLEGASGEARLRLSLPLGRTVVIARLTRPDGTVRLVNLPVSVTASPAKSEELVLSLERPDGAKPGVPWDIPGDGARLKGVTQPGKELIVDGKPLRADERDGAFEVDVFPTWEEHALTFTLASGMDEKEFKKELVCPECRPERHRWYAPRLRAPGDVSVFVSPGYVEIETEVGGFFNQTDAREFASSTFAPSIHAGAAWTLSPRFFVEAGGSYFFARRSSSGINRYEFTSYELSIDSRWRADLLLGWQAFRFAGIAGGVGGMGGRVVATGTGSYLEKVDTTPTLGISLAAFGRFALDRRWECTPRFSAYFSLLGAFPSTQWLHLAFEPVVVRYLF